MVGWQSMERLTQCNASLLILKVRDWVLGLTERHPIQRASRFLLLQRIASRGHPRLVGAKIRDNPQQPRRKFSLIAIAMKVLVRPDKRLLD